MLETFILIRQDFKFVKALKTACGMSFISMLSMEISMNFTDYFLTGGAQLTYWGAHYVNCRISNTMALQHWRLKKFNQACH